MFEFFWEEVGLKAAWTVATEHLLRFMLYLKDSGFQARSVAVYLSAISFVSGTAGVVDKTSEFRVQKMLEG